MSIISKSRIFILVAVVCVLPTHAAHADDDAKAIIGGIAGALVTHALEQAKKTPSVPEEEIRWSNPAPPQAPIASAENRKVEEEAVHEEAEKESVPVKDAPITVSTDADTSNFWIVTTPQRKMELEKMMYAGALGNWAQVLADENNAHLFLWGAYSVYIRIKAYYEAMEGESQVYVTDQEYAKSKESIKEIESGIKALHPDMKTDDVWDVAVEDLGDQPRNIKGSPYAALGIQQANTQITTLTTLTGFVAKAEGKRVQIDKDF